MTTTARVAFFPDSFQEANGVARTSRALVAAAARHQQPFLCVQAGDLTCEAAEGTTRRLQLARGPASFGLEHDLRHDLLLWRHAGRVLRAVRAFGADLVHITGPSDIGQLGLFVARRLNLPLVASWHTNLHEFAACRMEARLRALPTASRRWISNQTKRGSQWATLRFYRSASVLLAPNPELVDFLQRGLGKPTFLMRRGVDTTLFHPDKRDVDDGCFRLGYVGRLSAEKNVRLLPRIERALLNGGYSNFRFVIVGDGSDRGWLEQQMTRADFTGLLHGEALARAYANMDLLVFPSETDAFGNVAQEALASGTPALVSSHGGPRFLVRPDVSGFVASNDKDFIQTTRMALEQRERLRAMRAAARQQARCASWDAVFDEVGEAYAEATTRAQAGCRP